MSVSFYFFVENSGFVNGVDADSARCMYDFVVGKKNSDMSGASVFILEKCNVAEFRIGKGIDGFSEINLL